jgi:glyoxylase-like metal-dependent hydrolase (beta-lactamase superfamily II)
MAEVKILIEGYASVDSGGHSCSTVSLVQDKGLNIIVDPGTLADQKILIDKLKEVGLGINDIDVVYLTHSHMDHCRNIGMFPQAKSLDSWGWWQGDVYSDYQDSVTDDIEVIETPGHSYDSSTLLVKTKDDTVAICGDVFWKENFPQDDPFASDKKKLKESRKKVLAVADYIIPGHGKMFKVKK